MYILFLSEVPSRQKNNHKLLKQVITLNLAMNTLCIFSHSIGAAYHCIGVYAPRYGPTGCRVKVEVPRKPCVQREQPEMVKYVQVAPTSHPLGLATWAHECSAPFLVVVHREEQVGNVSQVHGPPLAVRVHPRPAGHHLRDRVVHVYARQCGGQSNARSRHFNCGWFWLRTWHHPTTNFDGARAADHFSLGVLEKIEPIPGVSFLCHLDECRPLRFPNRLWDVKDTLKVLHDMGKTAVCRRDPLRTL